MTNQANNTKASDAQFMIQRLYIKDLSFEAPNAPEVFKQKWEPELTLDLHNDHKNLDEKVYEVELTLTATVKNDNKTAFIVEVKQAGIFTIDGVKGDQLDHLLGSFCPNILFPYAREAITSEVIRGSFPQLVIAPINFDALYFKQLEEKKKQPASKN